MLGSYLLTIMIFMLIFSTNFESPLKTTAQIDTKTATKQPQSTSDQNQTDLGPRETFKVIEDGNISMSTILKLLSKVIETRLNKSSTLLELTSKLPEVTNISYANAISEKFMGIPQDIDLQKRNVAKDILGQDKDIASIFFLTPNGDVYMGEPYPDQQQLPRLNFADRDWYKGVRSTNVTYTSAVFFSAAIHVPAVAIAVPVYGNDMKSKVRQDVTNTSQPVVGYWVSIMNLTKIKEDLQPSIY
jgi:Cache domain